MLSYCLYMCIELYSNVQCMSQCTYVCDSRSVFCGCKMLWWLVLSKFDIFREEEILLQVTNHLLSLPSFEFYMIY